MPSKADWQRGAINREHAKHLRAQMRWEARERRRLDRLERRKPATPDAGATGGQKREATDASRQS